MMYLLCVASATLETHFASHFARIRAFLMMRGECITLPLFLFLSVFSSFFRQIKVSRTRGVSGILSLRLNMGQTFSVPRRIFGTSFSVNAAEKIFEDIPLSDFGFRRARNESGSRSTAQPGPRDGDSEGPRAIRSGFYRA